MLPGLANVVRFPIELRVAPSMEVIYVIEPDCREVFRVAESFKLELPDPDLANQVDAETAIYIAEQILPLSPSEQKAALDELLDPVLKRAVHACRFMDRVSKQSVQAELELLYAQTDGRPRARRRRAGRKVRSRTRSTWCASGSSSRGCGLPALPR